MGKVLRVIGKALRTCREEQGLSLGDVAHILKVRRLYLQYIEDGDTSEIPGTVYYLGYLKEYATFLGLDEKEFTRYCQQDEFFLELEQQQPQEKPPRRRFSVFS